MKKLISFILALSVVVSVFTVPYVSTEAAVSRESGVEALVNSLGIMQGDGNGDMGYERYVSRAEFAKIAIAASPNKDTVAIGLKMSPYKDVRYTEWYAPYVWAAVKAGYVEGYLDSTFRPDNTVTYEEAVTVMLRVLGYGDENFGAAYPYGQIAKAQGLNMLEDVNGQIGEPLTRRQVMYLVYNSVVNDIFFAIAENKVTYLLSEHDCIAVENVDIISTVNEDSSLGIDEVYTSSGSYTKGENFYDNSVGMTGDIYIRNSREVIAFVPDMGYSGGIYKQFFVYSVLGDSVIGYSNGEFENINIPNSTTVYKDQSISNYLVLKSSLEMGDTLNVKYRSSGSIDYVTYSASNMQGPVKVTTDSWMSNIGASSNATVMRDGVKSTPSGILANDIVYYSKSLNMVFAYSNKVTGVYESASPTKDSPTSVTISGVTYEIEGVDAFNALSSSGVFNYGDTITACLGKDGKIAGVVYGTTSMSNSSTTNIGYVTAAGKKNFTDTTGKEYSSYYVDVVYTDGSTGTYEIKSNGYLYEGKVCSIKVKDGVATVTRLSNAGELSGKVSYEDMKIGGINVSSSVRILDVAHDSIYDVVLYKKVFMQRINKLTLKSNQILYYDTDATGEVTDIILNDVTGDVYDYGATTAQRHNYLIDVNGASLTYSPGGTVQSGPCKVMMKGNSISGVKALYDYSGYVSTLTSTTAKIGNLTYKLSDTVVCYKKSSGTAYQMITIDDAINGDYNIKAYYDKPESVGGRIRILICNE